MPLQTQRRIHAMPFGAELQEDRRVRFRLWAPAAKQVELSLVRGAEEILLPLSAEGNGWFSLLTDQACGGSRYRYLIDADLLVPDPASRFQPEDVHGPSQVVDARHWRWKDIGWRGRPWEEIVIYELHLGCFTSQGSFAAARERLDYLANLGVTAIQLMPVADFPGLRNWGYDGVSLFAPDSRYGTPDQLKELIQIAHSKQLMVFLDVVYNHFGPEGNYLYAYAPDFLTDHHHTPWGDAINFAGPNCETVRQYFIHNALYWLEEYHLDGLRLDAVHAIIDNSNPDILEELAEAVKCGPGRHRHIHLILENDNNAAHYLRRSATGDTEGYTAQWNDDFHHCLHVILTGETEGYYADYADRPIWYLGRCLAEGFAYQGEPSTYRQGAVRGESSRELPPNAFVSFLQNHDQVGNRAFGERLSTMVSAQQLRAAVAVLLLAPAPPLLFMGEEFAAKQPFLFFSNLEAELAAKVTEGRRKEFACFERFADSRLWETIPDPNAEETFLCSRLNWDDLADPEHQAWLGLYQQLLQLRHKEIVPRLGALRGNTARFSLLGDTGLSVSWVLGDGSQLTLLTNLSFAPLSLDEADVPIGDLLFFEPQQLRDQLVLGVLAPWSVAWFLQPSAP